MQLNMPLNTKCYIGGQDNTGDDSGKVWMLILQIQYVVKMNDRLHYISLSSDVKRAHKRKEGRESATRDFTKNGLGG